MNIDRQLEAVATAIEKAPLSKTERHEIMQAKAAWDEVIKQVSDIVKAETEFSIDEDIVFGEWLEQLVINDE